MIINKRKLSKSFLRVLITTSLVIISIANLKSQYPDRFVHLRAIPENCQLWQSALVKYAREDLTSAIIMADSAINIYSNGHRWDYYLFINSFKAQLQGEISNPQGALATLQQARDMIDGINDQRIEYIENLLLTARVYTLTNDYETSEYFFNQAARILENSNLYPEVLALTYFNLWQLHSNLMNSAKAREYITKATHLLRDTDSEYSKAILFFIQAERLDRTQQYLKAELFMAAARSFENSQSTGDFIYFTTLMKLSQQFSGFQRDYEKAVSYGNKAEEFALRNNMSRAKVYGLNFALGDLYRNFEQYDRALPYFINAKEITSDIFGTQSMEYITACLYLGRLYRYMRLYPDAGFCFNKAYSAGTNGWDGKFPHEYTLYGEYSRLYLQWEKPDSALHYAHKRLIYEQKDKNYSLHEIPPTPGKSNLIRYYRSLAVKIDAYKKLYQQTQDTSLLSHGLNHSSYALEVLDIINDQAMEEKAGLLNSKRTKVIATYGIYFSLEMHKHNHSDHLIKQAIMFSERSNANYLKYLLHSRYSDMQPIDNYEAELRLDLEKLQTKLQSIAKDDPQQYDSLYSQKLSLNLSLANVVLNARPRSSSSPERLSPAIPQLNIDSLQQQLSDGTGILVFHIDNYEDDSELIMPDFERPVKRMTRFYIDNTEIKYHTNPLTELQVAAFQNYLRSLKTGNMTGYTENGKTLYNILFDDLFDNINSKQKIAIIPDPTFSDIPLESLPVDNTGRVLCHFIATSYHYSIGLWALSNSKTKDNDRLNFAAFAPDFSIFENIAPKIDDHLISLSALPMAKQEVLLLGNLFTDLGANVKVRHEQITKHDFIASVHESDIIHIASHGFADTRNFRNSGIYFSGVDQNHSIDILHLNELYSLSMRAHLVVLSACQTSVGQKVQGEGVMALPRGFIYTGVPNVIASLWKVHDEKTKELMEAFYTQLLKGRSYAEALRLARIDSIAKGYLPIDWAGFILIGG